MARNENPPFQRGTTVFGELGTTPDLTTVTQWLGKTWLFEDVDLNAAYSTSGSVKPNRTNRYVLCMVVQNRSGGALAPKRMVKLDITTPEMFGSTSGYCTAPGDFGYPVDEYLPGTVADKDIFWVVVAGPAKATTAAAGDTNFAAGAYLDYAADGKVVQNAGTFADTDNNIPGYATVAVNAINTDFVMNVLPRGIV